MGGCIGDKALIEKVKARVDLLQKRLQQAQDQGTILEQRLIQYETLYGRAAPTQKALRYNVRLKLAIYNGVKMMFYHYAEQHFTEMQKLQYILGFLQSSSLPGETSSSLADSFEGLGLERDPAVGEQSS